MFWLPLYIKETQGESDNYVATCVSYFEVGALVGAFLIGIISDLLNSSRYLCLCVSILVGSILTVFLTKMYSGLVIALIGAFIGGSSLVISIVQPADIGMRVKGQNSLATIAGLIDGFGSLGACLG